MNKLYSKKLIPLLTLLTAKQRKVIAVIILSFLLAPITSAQVSITAPSLTINTCGTFPTDYSSLGDIVIKEKSSADFSIGANQTLILTAPANFEFQPQSPGTVSYTSGNISSATSIVTANTITVTYSISKTNSIDQLTISGIMIRGINGVATNQKIIRTDNSQNINGDTTGTVHATLSSQILPTPTLTTNTSQVSCTGSSTNIALTSNPTGATFSWVTGTIDHVTGASSGSGNLIAQTLSSVDRPGTVEYLVTPVLNGCSGTQTTITNTVNPKASVTAVPDQVVCDKSATTAIHFSSPTQGGIITYSWANNNTNIGLSSGGTGDIASFTATNSTNSPITATITVTPTYSNGGVSCTGTPTSFGITVNPTATVNTVTDQAVCLNTTTPAVTFSSSVTPGTVDYSWTNSNTVIGLAASGTGNLPSFSSKNAGISPLTSIITVTPTYTNAGTACVGSPAQFNFTVYPVATVNAVANQTVCNNSPTAAINFTSAGTGTVTYNWTNNAPYIGLDASGTGNIPSFSPVNGGSTAIVATITVTPSYNGCPGTPTTFNITVNPTATMDNVADPVYCNNSPTSQINFTSPTTGTISYSWTNSNTDIGLAATGNGNISTFTATNTGAAPISSIVNVTPSINNAGKVCAGTPDQFNIVINPTPTINAIADQTFCNGSSVSSMAVTGSAPGSVYTWVNDNSTIGLSGAGNGDLPAFTATNTGNEPVSASIRLNSTYTNGGVSCNALSSFNITVNPTATVNAVTNQVVCNSAPTTEIDFSTSATGAGTVTYNWINNNASIGLPESGTGNIGSFTGTNTGDSPVTATITVTAVYSNGGNDCAGTPTTFTITVNPTPKALVTDQVACNQSAFTPAEFASTATGGTTTYSWANSNTTIGLASNGTGNLPAFTTSNSTNDLTTATITVTPVFANAGVSCEGPVNSFDIVVNPTATVVPVDNQTVCNQSSTSAVHFSTTTVGSVSYHWENNTVSIGLPASGTGDIPAFTATNTGTAPLTATIKVTPYYTNGSSSCEGTPQTFTITVNPTAKVNAVSNQVVCNNGLTAAINFTSTATGGDPVTYSWTNTNSTIGLAGSGTGNIPAFAATNSTNAPVTATITVTPLYTSGVACSGTPITFTITVNPTPTVNTVSDQTLCSNTPTNTITFGGNVAGTVYSWNNNQTSIGLAASGNSTIAPFTAMNSGTTAVGASVTVTPLYTNTGVTCSGDPKTFTITVNPLPEPSLSGPNPICPNSTDVYTTEAGMHNYTWTQTGGTITSGGTAGDNSATITWGNSTGVKTIYINYTNGNGCTGATSVTVANAAGSSPGLSGPALVCEKSTANVYSTETGKINYSWNIPEGGTIISGGGSTDATATVRWDNPGNKVITVNYADLGGCNAATPTTYSVKVNPLPTASISGTATVCLNSGAAKVTFTGATGQAPYTFTYKINGGTTQIVTTTSGNSVTVDQPSTSTGTYVYTLLTVQDGSTTACVQNQTGSATITVKPLPTATISGATAVCANSTSPNITFTGGAGTAPYTFTYTINGGTNQMVTSSGNSVTIPVNTSTAGTLTYSLVNVKEGSANYCSVAASGTAAVRVNPLPTASISGSTTVCIGSASPNVTFTGANGTAPYTFSYSINGGATQTIKTTSGNSVNLQAATNVAGTFNYQLLSVQDASSTACSQVISAGSATVKVDSKPVGGTLSPGVITGACTGSNSGSISLSGQLGNVTRWEYSTNGGASWSTVSPNVTSTTLTYSNITATSLYRAVVQNGVCGDTAVSKVAIVVVSPIFTPVVKYLPTLTICVGDSVTMTASGLSNDKTSLVDGEFDDANPAGWVVTNNAGTSIPFPANGDNANVHPWTETNGPKTYYSGTTDAITYDSQFDKKFAIANGQLTTTLETPVFSLVGMVSPTFDFYQAYHLLPGTTARIEISTDGGAHYTGILADYQPGDLGVTNAGFVHSFVPLTNYIGLDNLKVKFTYSSTSNSSWALDNLKLVNTFLPVSYLWHSEGYTYSTQTITVSPPVGTHVFDLVTKTGECSITTTELTVIVNGLPTINPGTAAICSNTSAQTLTLPYTNPNYSPENYSIIWNAPTNGLQPATGTLNSSNTIAVALPAGLPAATYSGMVKVTNSTGCISPAVPFSFVVNQTPVIANQTPAAICSGSSVTLTSTSFTGTNTVPANTTFSWAAPVVAGITGLTSGSAQTAFSTGNLLNTTSQPISIVYSVTPKSPAACPGVPFTITVTVNPTQILSTVPANATLCPEPFTSLSTTFSVVAANATIFQWQENRGAGWVNLTNNTNYSGVTTNTLTVNNITEAMEGYQYRTSLANPAFCYSTYSAAATLLITNVWKGTTSTNWSTPSNWWGNVVPDINCQYVIVPVVSTKLYPILKGTETQEVRNIVVRQNASVTVTQSATLQVRGAIYSNIANFQYGYMDATDGRIELNGGSSHTYAGTDTAQIIAGSLFKVRTLKDLQISNPLSATVKSTPNDTLNITGTLSFGPVNNTILHTGNNITLISLAAKTARVADITNGLVNSGNNFDGDVIVERFINTGSGSNQHGMAWEFLAVPTTGQTVKQSWMENGSFAKTGYGTQIPSTYGTAAGFDLVSPFSSIKYYKAGSIENSSSPDWIGVTNANNQLYNPAGYMLFVAGDRSVAPPLYKNPVPTRMRSKGKLFTYTVSLPLAGASFSSIGNPYASAIDMRKVFEQSPDADPFFSTWASPKPGSYGYGSFVTYSKSGNDFIATPGGFINNNVESGQAFLIQSTLPKGGNIIFNETSKTAGSTSTVFRTPVGNVGQIRTNFYSNNGKNNYLLDGTLSEFNDDYNPEVDRNDAWKIYKGGENLSIVKPGKNLIIERTKTPTDKDTVFFAMSGLLKQNYRFEFVCKAMSVTGVQAFVVDNYLHIETPLNMEDTTMVNFTVNSDKASSASNRFEIVFRQKIVLLVAISFNAHAKEDDVEVVWNVAHEKNMHQYEVERSMDGKLYTSRYTMAAKNIDSSTYNWEDKDLLPGYYYYRLKSISNTGKVTYSESVKVLIGDGNSSIKIYPNPIKNGIINLQMLNMPAGKYGIRLTNQLGQVIVSKEVEQSAGSGVEKINWDYKLAHAAYQLQITLPDGQVKIIKVLY